jgi:hypothetical protein
MVAPDSVRIYRTVDQVKGKYEELALLRSDGPDGSKDSKMLASMRKKAGELGANGIILVSIDDPGLVTRIAAAVVLAAGAEKKARSVAIFVFPDSTAR